MRDVRSTTTSLDRRGPAAPASTGDGNSVMFSLSALLAQGTPAAAPSRQPASRAAPDGSGLIDLTALAGGPIEFPTHLAVLPFGLPPAPAAQPVVAEITPAPATRSRARAWAIGALAVAAAAGVALAVPLGPRAERGAPAASGLAAAARAASAQLPAIAPEPAPVPVPVPVVAPTPDPRVQPPVRTAPPRPRPPSERVTTPPATPTPKPPAADPCRGDLQCAIERAARR